MEETNREPRPNPYNAEFKIEKLDYDDVGKWSVRLSKRNRCGHDRHCLVRVSHCSIDKRKSAYFIALGLKNQKDDIIQMDFDARETLGISGSKSTSGTYADLEIRVIERGNWRALGWYFCHRDPGVYVPAFAWATSMVLAVAAFLLGLCNLK